MSAPWLILLVVFSVCRGLQWPDHLQDGKPVQLCSGDDIQLLWNYTLDGGELLKGMEWTYQPVDLEQKLLATCYGDVFVPAAEFSGRLSHLKEGSIEMSCATILESGNYSINVYTEDDLNSRIIHSRTATVTVIDTPKTTEGDLHITKHDDPVQDDTGEWHVQLSCGNFSDTGHPSIDVIWTTPDGQRLASSGFETGMFHLLVPNPVVGGNYSCSVPMSGPVARCLPKDSLLRTPVSVEVEENKSMFALLEARQQELLDKMAANTARLMNMINGVVNGTDGPENKTGMVPMSVQLEENRGRISLLEAGQQQLLDKMAADAVRFNGYVNRTDGVENKMDEYIASRHPVYFHVRLAQDTYVSSGNTLVMTNVITNTDDVYDINTGSFTAPEHGTYVLMVAAGNTGSGSSSGYLRMLWEGEEVARTYLPWNSYRRMGSLHAVLELNAGERVWLKGYSSSTFLGPATSFIGFRL